MRGKYKVVKGDIFKSLSGDKCNVIAHVCNNLGVWGKGFTAALDKRWPEVGKYYQTYLYHVLGTNIVADTASGDIVVCMIAQDGLPSNGNKRPLKYAALVECMVEVLNRTKMEYWTDLRCPKFGSGLARGNWEFIEELIKEIWVDNGLNVTVYELE